MLEITEVSSDMTYLSCYCLVLYSKFDSCYVSRPATYLIHHFAGNVAWQCKRQESTFNLITLVIQCKVSSTTFSAAASFLTINFSHSPPL
jgi:hypothetical protein